MHFLEYQLLAMRTKGLYTNVNVQSMAACLGIGGETGEYLDLQKKRIFHSKAVSDLEQQKELGDILWYIALECDAKGWNMDTIAGLNIEKLKARYPQGFSYDAANQRVDLQGAALK